MATDIVVSVRYVIPIVLCIVYLTITSFCWEFKLTFRLYHLLCINENIYLICISYRLGIIGFEFGNIKQGQVRASGAIAPTDPQQFRHYTSLVCKES